MIQDFFQKVLNKHLPNVELENHHSVGGGCINNAARLQTNFGNYFIKWNTSEEIALFETEAKGLSLLAESSTLKIPRTLGRGKNDGKAYLLLEWIEKGHASGQFWKDFGAGLAHLHQQSAQYFGLDHDNYIGRLPQGNNKHENWYDFFIQERLVPQLKLASANRLIDEKIRKGFDRLLIKLPDLVPEEKPSLLHGDLWSGNFLIDQNSNPVLIDPAVYYGHRETELAFTHLFGGFEQQFYTSYQSCFPLENGFEERIEIHNLYPLLVHVNLFGASYLSGIRQTLKRFG